ncbi:esterase [Microbacterium phage Shocker]|uniref:Esterase n=1 Tax=Microbacterium phage Shocker TaxID=2805839 RepID=A0A890V0Z5_9CAUD|nr:esterase [Microbacterium phage Shocker]QRI45084.1 esterase [Microbacterium phage Shocker]
MTDYRGVTWRVNYGEISERDQFRVGYINQESYDGYFELSSLADLISVLSTVSGLSLNQIARGVSLQARKVSDGLLTSIRIEPRLDTGEPPRIMQLKLADLTDLLYALGLFQADLASASPDDWDISEKLPVALLGRDGKLPETTVPDRLSPAGVAEGARWVAGGSRFIALGDSLTSLAGGGAPYMGWATQLGILSDGQLQVLRNAGVPGDNAADIRARLQADVLAYAPTLVSLWVGTNDITQGRTLAAYKADVQAIVAALKEAGASVALLTIPPRADASKAATISAWNAWLKTFARAESIHLVDAHAALSDPATSTYKSGYDSGDGVHISQSGHNAVANLFATEILPRLSASRALTPLSNTDPQNLLSNGLLLTNVDGTPTVPDSFFYIGGEAAVNVSVVDDADFRGGKAWQYAAVNPTSFQEFLQNAAAAWSPGDQLLFTFKLKVVSSSGVSGASGLNVNCNFFGSTGINPAAQFISLAGLKGRVSSVFTVPSGTTTVQLDLVFNLGASASATYRVGEFAIYNLTRMGVV